MKIIVNAKKLSLDEWTRERIEKKLGKLDRYFKADAEAAVRLSESRGIFTTEVTVNAPPMVFRAQERNGDMIASFDTAVDHIDRQIRKNKTHLEKKLREGAFEFVAEQDPREPVEEETDLRPVRVKRFSMVPMTVEEAILQMNLLGHRFYAFRNAEDGDAFAVIYVRADGGYGLIAEEE